jgi:TolB-like protein
VLILPFSMVGGRAADSWLVRSVQQALLTDLVTSGPVQAATGATPAADAAAAAEAGRAANARYVLTGSIHVNDRPDYTAVRVTGQLIDPATGRAVGTIKATGPLDDLFGLEDEVTGQARRQLAWLGGEAAATHPGMLPAGSPAPAGAPPIATAPAPGIEPSGPVRNGDYGGDMGYAVPDYGPTVPPAASYRYYYSEPYYSYGLTYPYYGSYGPYYYYPSASIAFAHKSSNFGLHYNSGFHSGHGGSVSHAGGGTAHMGGWSAGGAGAAHGHAGGAHTGHR